MIENNLFNFWRLGMNKKIVLPFFYAPSNYQNHYYSQKYDLGYMINKYSDNSNNIIQCFNQINPNGTKNMVNFISLESLSFMKKNNDFNLWNNYIFDQCLNRLVGFKKSFQKILSSVRMRRTSKTNLNLLSNSVDIVYSNISLTTLSNSSKMNILSEILRVLNKEGEFYFSMPSSEFYDSIYQLLEEFDTNFANKLDPNQFIDIDSQEISKYLKSFFLDVNVKKLNSDWWVTDVDDLIGYLLSDHQFLSLRTTISQYGLSNFRKFLINKIKKDGGILIKRQINVISGKHKCN